ncbi:hypothetical protein PoMZ_03192 [Pyricularia oryzae]|uniref:Uncharacterized protein n=1 Tax=Pyricularia oryzae TaxID=318829 RepID=A0A4P7N6L1_PYROR|nr:hypothetical protein PoMZ_03192 [Pyricularia oryzae]
MTSEEASLKLLLHDMIANGLLPPQQLLVVVTIRLRDGLDGVKVCIGRRAQQDDALLGQVVLGLGDEPPQKLVLRVVCLFRLELVRDGRVVLPGMVPEDEVKLALDLLKDVTDGEVALEAVGLEVLGRELDRVGVDVDSRHLLGSCTGDAQGHEPRTYADLEPAALVDDGRKVSAIPPRLGEVCG